MNKKSDVAKIEKLGEIQSVKEQKQRRGKMKAVLAVENKSVVF
jgi:hypothetical protein